MARWRWLLRARCRVHGHRWRFYGGHNEPAFTGFLERCEVCGDIRQVPQ